MFVARLPPLGYSTFVVEPADDGCAMHGNAGKVTKVTAAVQQGTDSTPPTQGVSAAKPADERYVALDNGIVRLEFDSWTGWLTFARPRCLIKV